MKEWPIDGKSEDSFDKHRRGYDNYVQFASTCKKLQFFAEIVNAQNKKVSHNYDSRF